MGRDSRESKFRALNRSDTIRIYTKSRFESDPMSILKWDPKFSSDPIGLSGYRVPERSLTLYALFELSQFT